MRSVLEKKYGGDYVVYETSLINKTHSRWIVECVKESMSSLDITRRNRVANSVKKTWILASVSDKRVFFRVIAEDSFHNVSVLDSQEFF